jgi:hypothetical protein
MNYIELCSVDRFGRSNRTELFTKKHKNNQKIRDKIELVRLSSNNIDNFLCNISNFGNFYNF